MGRRRRVDPEDERIGARAVQYWILENGQPGVPLLPGDIERWFEAERRIAEIDALN
jgi:hypothetical protein